MPGLIWNMMVSMSGGWFMIVFSEAITVGDTTVTLPGIGSYIAKANEQGRWDAIFAAVVAMALVILAYDQVFFRPIVAWAGKFRVELSASQTTERSWVLDALLRTYWLRMGFQPIFNALRSVSLWRMGYPPSWSNRPAASPTVSRLIDVVWILLIVAGAAWALWSVVTFVGTELTWDDVWNVFVLTSITLLRVLVLMAVATIIWVPISVWIGLRPRIAERVQPMAQFLAAFPVNLLFGAAVAIVLAFHLNPDIWLSILIITGTQWYIVFNVIAGAAAFPNDLREAAANFHIHGWDWWTRGDSARRAALLFHRRDHRFGRLLERFHRRRICEVEGPDRRRPRHRRLYLASDGERRFSENRSRRRDDVDLRRRVSIGCSGAGSMLMRNAACGCSDGRAHDP